MATHSSMLAWKIPWTEEPTYSPWGRQELGTTEQLHFHFSLSCIGEGNGNLLQCSCLENPRDGGAWWAAVYGVAQSDTTEATSQQQQRISKHYYNLVAHMVKNLPQCRDPSSIPGSGRSPGGGKATIHGVAKSQTELSD